MRGLTPGKARSVPYSHEPNRIGPGPTSATAALVAAVAFGTAECTTAMNEQFAALMLNDPNISRFEAKIAEVGLKRKLAMDALLEHIRLYGW